MADVESTALLMSDFNRITDEEHEGSVDAAVQVDKFKKNRTVDEQCSLIYKYYLRGGLMNIILSEILNKITMLIIVMLILVLGFCFDYKELQHMLRDMNDPCPGTNPPRVEEPSLFLTDCHGNRPFDGNALTRLHPFVYFNIAAVMLAWLLSTVSSLRELSQFVDTKRFYRIVLKIDEVTLQTIPWSKVVKQILIANVHYGLFSTRSNETIDPWTLISLMMRKENYMIALFNNVLSIRLRIPWLGIKKGWPILTQQLQWNMNLILRNVVFDGPKISQNIMQADSKTREKAARSLRTWFLLCGLGNILLSPYILIYRLMLFFLSYSDLLKGSPGVLAMRTWRPYALWRLRKYNEMEHYLERRLARAYKPAVRYINMFHNRLLGTFARFMLLALGGVFLVMLAFGAVFDEDFFQLNFLGDRSVAWWFSILGVILGLARSQLPNVGEVSEPREPFNELKNYVSYLPESWARQPEHPATMAGFCEFFPYRIVVIVEEILSVITTPIMLLFIFPSQCNQIVQFFFDNSVMDSHGYGHIFSKVPAAADTSPLVASQTQPVGLMEQSVYAFRSEYDKPDETDEDVEPREPALP